MENPVFGEATCQLLDWNRVKKRWLRFEVCSQEEAAAALAGRTAGRTSSSTDTNPPQHISLSGRQANSRNMEPMLLSGLSARRVPFCCTAGAGHESMSFNLLFIYFLTKLLSAFSD